jgi:hypothetical protein
MKAQNILLMNNSDPSICDRSIRAEDYNNKGVQLVVGFD